MYQKIIFSILAIAITISTFAQNGTIQGRVFDPITNESLGFANVIIQGTTTGAQSDIDGKYKIENLEPGLYNLEVSYLGFKTATVFEVEVNNARVANIDIAMEPSAEKLKTVEIVADPFSKSAEAPLSLRSIGVDEIKRNPGGSRDISKVVQSLPGVASTPTFRNDILIRGGAPSENRFYIDGIEVPTINHFATQGSSGGPVGMINVDFVREVNFYSGAFPTNIGGNALSSVFDFRFKDGNPDRLNTSFTIGSSDVGLTFDGPLGDKANFIFSARRSYLQFLFEALELPFLPTYNDFQFKLKYNINSKSTLTILGIGAIDQFKLNLAANETEEQQYLLNVLPVNEQWNYTNGFKFTRFHKSSYTNFIFSRNMLNNTAKKYVNNDDSNEANLLLDYISREAENKFRIENVARINEWKLTTGVSYELAKYTNSTFNKISVGDSLITINYNSELNLNKYGAFAQASKAFFNNKLNASFGLRIDGSDFNDAMTNPFNQVSPRLSLSYKLAKDVNLNFNTGVYHQLPTYTTLGYQENNVFVNANNNVKFINNAHIVGGLEYLGLNNAKVSLEGFYKLYNNYPFSIKDSLSLANVGGDFGVIGDEAVSSIGKGQTYGLELLFQQKLYKGFYGLASYTLSFSEFEDKNGDLTPSTWDTRHIVNLTAGKKFKKNWELGVKWRYNTGSPYTPYDLATSALIPVWDVNNRGVLDYDRLNTERITAAHQMDIRVDKKWFFNKWNLNLYLDIENLYSQAPTLQPDLVVERDENNILIVDPNDPSRYQTKFLENGGAGTVLPSIGLIVEF